MTHAALNNAIRSRFDTLVATVESVPTQYDNTELAEEARGDLWVRFTILSGDSNQIELGNTTVTFRTIGVAIAQVFCPINTGDAASLALADKIKAAFRRITVPSIYFRTPRVVKMGRVGNDWQINVECPFFSDDRS